MSEHNSMLLPVGDTNLMTMRPWCRRFNCEIEYSDKDKVYYKISSPDAVNFYWLGANMNNELLNQLYGEIRQLKKSK